MKNLELAKIAKTVLTVNLGIKPGEEILIISDTKCDKDLAMAFWSAAYTEEAEPQLAIIRPRRYRFEHPPKMITSASRSCDAILQLLGSYYIWPWPSEHGKRELVAPYAETGWILDLMNLDMDKISTEAHLIANSLIERTVRIKSQRGTNITFRTGAKPHYNSGIARKPGVMEWLPPGNPSVVPAYDGEGIVVGDGSWGRAPLFGRVLHDPVSLTVRNNKIQKIEGGWEARELNAFIEQYKDPNCFNCPAEFGIGLNPNINKLTGVIYRDERKRGVVHLGCGDNANYGGPMKAKQHYDVTIRDATVILDEGTSKEKVILDKGTLKI